MGEVMMTVLCALPGMLRSLSGPRQTHNDIGITWAPQGASALISVFGTRAVKASPEAVDAAIADATRQAVANLGLGRD